MIIIDRAMSMHAHRPAPTRTNGERYAEFRAAYPAVMGNNHPWPHLAKDRTPEFLRDNHEPSPLGPDDYAMGFEFKYGRDA